MFLMTPKFKFIVVFLKFALAFVFVIMIIMLDGCNKIPKVQFFPVQKEGLPQMVVAGNGQLVLDHGYLKLRKFFGILGSDFIIFPYGYTYNIQKNTVNIINEKEQIVAKVGDFVKTGGGEVTEKTIAEKIVGTQLPSDFNGPYWVAGDLKTR